MPSVAIPIGALMRLHALVGIAQLSGGGSWRELSGQLWNEARAKLDVGGARLLRHRDGG